ncbi:TonB-dependent receptor [Larkinella knui]|uniref:TonB-dependent receptor n=1 Tax=Larkinella knui TaxID=2025310 RepID=A0A3P1CKD1_9BACT|nr:TonB-dependent receptor [Larkinella knui]RRB13745.1 TonB-dependent receptor [Larkinella knui]
MKNVLIIGITLLLTHLAQAQSLHLRVEDSVTHAPLSGVTIRTSAEPPTGTTTDAQGQAQLASLPNGPNQLIVTLVGYQPYRFRLTLPLASPDSVVLIELAPTEAALEEVTVTATRSNSRLEDLPIKVEVLGLEEMDEESAVVPGNVASILGDISIIHIQRTSLTTGNQSIRMQGLDPKYTQILRDGLPLYEGFSGNLGVLQIPPLDLKQVEVIKGSASTLYGGGAIGGLINLVSRQPGAEPELTMVLNRSNLRETNLNAYYARQYNPKTGLTVFAGLTNQPAVDVNQDGFSDAPLIHQVTVHPRLFLTPSTRNRLNLGYTFITEKRSGGDVTALKQPEGLHTYVVSNTIQRHSADATFDHRFSEKHTFTGRGTLSFFDRTEVNNGFHFSGRQLSGYFEAADYSQRGAHALVAGANLTLEHFRKGASDSSRISDFTYNTVGLFLQDDWRAGNKVTLQGGLRLDHHTVFGNFFLPRLSVLIKPNEQWSVRTSVGTGYKTPNIFANLTAADSRTQSRLSYRYLLPLRANLKSERSVGLNLDVAYKSTLGEHLTVQLDQAFYYTFISNPIVALSTDTTANRRTLLQNANYDLRSVGTDTYLRLEYDEIEFYLGYNHTLARRQAANGTNLSENTYVPFSPQDKFSLTLAYHIPEKWRFGIESSWVGNQYVYDNRRVANYWFWAAAIERMLGHFSLILNAENIFNIQQLKYGPVVTGPINNPTVQPLWAPQEGRIVNLAIKYKWH